MIDLFMRIGSTSMVLGISFVIAAVAHGLIAYKDLKLSWLFFSASILCAAVGVFFITAAVVCAIWGIE